MDFNINMRFQASGWFWGVLAELNNGYSDWTDGSYDWADQTKAFLHAPTPLPEFDEEVFNSSLSKQAIDDLLHIAIALMTGDYPLVRSYLADVRFAFVVGYPRSGGSYVTKELLRTVGLDHTSVSEALAHDGFPEIRDIWYDWAGDKPYFHLQTSIFQTAEFLVISRLYYQAKTKRHGDDAWLIPKKMHKFVNWAGSFKMLLGQGHSDYLVTLRHPLPTAISAWTKSGGLPADGLFPIAQPRSAIEHWIVSDLMMSGVTATEIAQMSYFEAVNASWSRFHAAMATSGLFLGDRNEVKLLPYGPEALEGVVAAYRMRYGNPDTPEAVLIRAVADDYSDWKASGDAAVAAMSALWTSLGLTFPTLTLS